MICPPKEEDFYGGPKVQSFVSEEIGSASRKKLYFGATLDFTLW